MKPTLSTLVGPSVTAYPASPVSPAGPLGARPTVLVACAVLLPCCLTYSHHNKRAIASLESTSAGTEKFSWVFGPSSARSPCRRHLSDALPTLQRARRAERLFGVPLHHHLYARNLDADEVIACTRIHHTHTLTHSHAPPQRTNLPRLSRPRLSCA